MVACIKAFCVRMGSKLCVAVLHINDLACQGVGDDGGGDGVGVVWEEDAGAGEETCRCWRWHGW